jgi:hypothetical protein
VGDVQVRAELSAAREVRQCRAEQRTAAMRSATTAAQITGRPGCGCAPTRRRIEAERRPSFRSRLGGSAREVAAARMLATLCVCACAHADDCIVGLPCSEPAHHANRAQRKLVARGIAR